MATFDEDFLFGDDLDAVLSLITDDVLTNEPELTSDVSTMIADASILSSSFQCPSCEKVCKTKGGLTRHQRTMHKVDGGNPKTPEDILHPLVMKQILMESVLCISTDECYDEEIRNEFTSCCVGDAMEVYTIVRKEILEYDGDSEKFYPKFYSKFIDVGNVYSLSENSTLLLAMDLANRVLAHLSGGKLVESTVYSKSQEAVFTEKQKNIIFYLSGYVVSTWYRRIRFGKFTRHTHHQKYLSFLLACKKTYEPTDSSNQKYTQLRDRCGLWFVNSTTNAIFTSAESYFRAATSRFVQKVHAPTIVSEMLLDSWVRSNFDILRNSAEQEIEEELGLNLLEDLITLYIRLRAHSYAKDKQQLSKMQKDRTKTKSLRTEMKKSSSSLDHGH